MTNTDDAMIKNAVGYKKSLRKVKTRVWLQVAVKDLKMGKGRQWLSSSPSIQVCLSEQANSKDEEDNQHAMKLAQQDRSDDMPLSRLDRVRLDWCGRKGWVVKTIMHWQVMAGVWKVVRFRSSRTCFDETPNCSRRDRNMFLEVLGGIGSWMNILTMI